MLRQLFLRIHAIAFVLTLMVTAGWMLCAPISADQPPAPAKKAASADDGVVQRLADLEKKLVDLQAQIGPQKGPRVVAAGTATWKLPEVLNNRLATAVKLSADIAPLIDDSCVVLLTPRYNRGGYPYLVAYSLKADYGFDILLVDTSLGNLTTGSYATRNKDYLVDWAVVKK